MADLTSIYNNVPLRDKIIQNLVDFSFKELRKSSEKVNFMEIFDTQGGTQPPKSDFIYAEREGYVRFLQIRDFSSDNTPTFIPQSAKNKLCEESDVLIGRYGASVGKILTGKAGAYNVACAKIKILSENKINKRFVFYLLHLTKIQEVFQGMTRGAQAGFNKNDLATIEFYLPNIALQNALISLFDFYNQKVLDLKKVKGEEFKSVSEVQKIHSNFINVFNNCLELEQRIIELSNSISLVDKLRQSILQDAVKGKLTEEWRKQNHDIESASDIIVKIQQEKERLVKEKVIKKEPSILPTKEEETLFNLPSNWSYCKLDDLVNVTGGLTKGKKPKSDMISSPYLRVANVQRGYLDLTEIKEILVSISDYRNYQLEVDDLLIIEGGDRDKVGRCAIWKNEIPGCIYQNHIYRLRPFKRELINEYYIMYYLNSTIGRNYFESKAKQTTNLATINKTVTRNFVIAIPPIKEQDVIVNTIQVQLKDCDKLERQILNSKSNAELLVQTILNELLGVDNIIEKTEKKETQPKLQKREIKFDSKTTYMELVKLLQEHGKLHAEDLWKMSKFPNDIDAFYAELKNQIEVEKTIKEIEKGYLELV